MPSFLQRERYCSCGKRFLRSLRQVNKENEYEEVDKAVSIIKECVEKLRAYSPTYSSKSTLKQKRGRKKKDEIV